MFQPRYGEYPEPGSQIWATAIPSDLWLWCAEAGQQEGRAAALGPDGDGTDKTYQRKFGHGTMQAAAKAPVATSFKVLAMTSRGESLTCPTPSSAAAMVVGTK